MQINYRPALELAQRRLAETDPRALADRSGADLLETGDGRELRLKLLHRDLRVPLDEMLVRDASSGEEAGVSATLVALHYLVTADGTPARGEWIPFRSLPGGNVYEQAFRRQCLEPLAASFGSDPEALRASAQALDGEPLAMGDVAFSFQALPRLPLACVLWLADEEQAAEANILFDAAAPHYLPTEDLAALGRTLAHGLIGAGGRKG